MGSKIKITFLGTGPSGRIPRPGCEAPACLDAERSGSRSRRLQSSLLLEYAGTAILFDISEDILKQWHHVGRKAHLDAIFISHPHGDAMGGIPRLDALAEKIEQDRIPVHAEAPTIRRISEEYEIPTTARMIRIAPGRVVRIAGVSVRPFRTEHTNKASHPTVGFEISAGDKRVILMTDVKRVALPTLKRLREPDLCIIDCALYTAQYPNHVNFAEAKKIIERLAPNRTYLTQIGVDWPPYTQAIKIARSAGLSMAYDGLKITL